MNQREELRAGRGGRKKDALSGEHRQNGSQDRRLGAWTLSTQWGHKGKNGNEGGQARYPTAPAPSQDSPSVHSGLRIML